MDPGSPFGNTYNSSIGGFGSPFYNDNNGSPLGGTINSLASALGSPQQQQQQQGGALASSFHDRYIPDRAAQDQDLSHFYLTAASNQAGGGASATKENQTSPTRSNKYAMGAGGLVEEPYAALLTKTLFPDAEETSVLGIGSPQKRPPTTPQKQQPQQGLNHNTRSPGSAGFSTPGTPHGTPQQQAANSNSGGGALSTPGRDAGGNHFGGSPNHHNLFGGGGGGFNSPTSPPQQRAPPSPHSPSSVNFENFTGSEMNRFNNSLGVVYHSNRQRNFTSSSFRVIPQTPERILDAPELIDDFYLNLIEWGSRNVLTVALSQTVYLWNAANGDIQQLMSTEERSNVVTGVCWHGRGEILAIGTNESEIELWDTKAQKQLRVLKGHTGRVGAMSWNHDLLASGSRDSTVRIHDLRCPNPVTILNNGHSQEVCGLRWSPNGQHLASGGNDNLLNFWDFRRDSNECLPLYQLRHHNAAVKALAWNPVHHNLLVSGGGTADKTLRFWDVNTGECLQYVDTKSQVCGALWNHAGTELVTSHGYSDNQLTLWKYPSLKRIADLTGHSSRVLHLSQSPNGEVVVSAAGDETIRFWRCFGSSNPHRSRTSRQFTNGVGTAPPPSTTTGGGSGGAENGGGGGGVAASGNQSTEGAISGGDYHDPLETQLR